MSKGWIHKMLTWRHRSHAGQATAEARIKACFAEQIGPALAKIATELGEQGYQPDLRHGDDWADLSVINYNGLPLIYAARGHVYKQGVVNLASLSDESSIKRYPRIEITHGGGKRQYRIRRCQQSSIERAARNHYRRFLMKTARG